MRRSMRHVNAPAKPMKKLKTMRNILHALGDLNKNVILQKFNKSVLDIYRTPGIEKRKSENISTHM